MQNNKLHKYLASLFRLGLGLFMFVLFVVNIVYT